MPPTRHPLSPPPPQSAIPQARPMHVKDVLTRFVPGTARRRVADTSSPRKQRRLDGPRPPLTELSNQSAIYLGSPSSPPPPPPPPSARESQPCTPTRRPERSNQTSQSNKARRSPPKNLHALMFGNVKVVSEGAVDLPFRSSVSPSPSMRIPIGSQEQRGLLEPGPFYLLERICDGSFGSTWAARDTSTRRVLCLKLTSKKIVQERIEHQRSIARELEAYQRVAMCGEATHVMQLHAVFQDATDVYLAMDLMDGDLWAKIAWDVGLPRPQVRRWMAQIATGLDALHNMGIMHRDVKPENILISPAGDARVSDLGSAFTHPSSRLARGVRYTNDLVYTPGYAAPDIVGTEVYGESWVVKEDHVWATYTVAVDWWALGCIFFVLIRGWVLFPKKRYMAEYVEWCEQRMGRAWLRDQMQDSLPSTEEQVLYGLLQVRPENRFAYQELIAEPYFQRESGGNEFDLLEHRARSAAQSLYRPEKPKYQVMDTTEMEPLDLVRATDIAELGEPGNWGFWRWFAWHNSHGMWKDWKGEKRWWAF